ncbi:MAG: hypothetical protein JSW71_02580 [Gemmatimonadota bacterium]|nr:MAG: hypothetical protein JSW71_02580 [Gemmatimonadota bacterium]
MYVRCSIRRLSTFIALGLSAALWHGCSDSALGPVEGPELQRAGPQGRMAVRQALTIHRNHMERLLRHPGVVGTAVGLNPAGRPVMQVFVTAPDIADVPATVEGLPVQRKVTGMFVAGSNPTTRERPAPLGFSVGHPDITAGTIGARVKDAAGNVYVLSNNHVLANSNDAQYGDPIYQPGPYDGGTPADQIATLSAFQPVDFSASGVNTIDAAIAQSTTAQLGNSTPLDDGYGTPSSEIFGDANGDGWFDDVTDLLGLDVQKYGRTTELTAGQITGISATVQICYEVFYIFCLKSAIFTDQLIIEPGPFSGGGDSGSLIVTDDDNKNAVALLFAGSSTATIANRIDRVLLQFGVSIDGEQSTPPPPTDPVTDVAVTAVSAPATVTQGAIVDVDVTVRNVGNQDVADTFTVALVDETDGATIGSQEVYGLDTDEDSTLTFEWDTGEASLATHTLTASHDLGTRIADEADATNDQLSTMSTVNEPVTLDHIHVGDMDAFTSKGRRSWSATVEITVHDANHNPINGATVSGVWNPAGLASDVCTTGELGGNGSCIMLYPAIPRWRSVVTFTVTSVVMPNKTYDAALNHDPDGDSDGTSITVRR